MSYFAAAAVRGHDGWATAELDLHGVADVDEVADRLRDVDPDAGVSLLFVEADDVYLVIMRLDEGEDLRIFGSDSAFAEESRLGKLLLSDIEEPALEVDAVVAAGTAGQSGPDNQPVDPDVDPIGDADLLTDLGITPHRLLELCGHGGMLPADVVSEVCQAIGCGDEVEELREA